jgi:hypothetical protein
MSARRLSVPMIVWSLIAPFTAIVLAAGLQPDTPDSSGPTAIEQALIEHACRGTRPSSAPENNAYDECLSTQLLSMRADLGRDLSGLSSAERKTLDSVCGDMRAAGGRESYLECLSSRLLTLRNRRRSAKPVPSDGTALAPPVVSAPAASAAPAARQASSWPVGLWIGVAFLAVAVAVGGVLLVLKARRPPRKCRVCSADLPESGDLCQTCRHEAAEAVRAAAMERGDQRRSQDVEQRQQGALLVDRGQKALQQVQDEEDARLRQQEDSRQREDGARRREEAMQQEEKQRADEARQRSEGVSQEVFDPYAVLGVPQDASKEDIGAAYQQARLKYDPDHVEHLSPEVQEHYRTKAEEVERAHQKLTE